MLPCQRNRCRFQICGRFYIILMNLLWKREILQCLSRRQHTIKIYWKCFTHHASKTSSSCRCRRVDPVILLYIIYLLTRSNEGIREKKIPKRNRLKRFSLFYYVPWMNINQTIVVRKISANKCGLIYWNGIIWHECVWRRIIWNTWHRIARHWRICILIYPNPELQFILLGTHLCVLVFFWELFAEFLRSSWVEYIGTQKICSPKWLLLNLITFRWQSVF